MSDILFRFFIGKYPDVESMYDTIEEMLADFEHNMNKLWEE